MLSCQGLFSSPPVRRYSYAAGAAMVTISSTLLVTVFGLSSLSSASPATTINTTYCDAKEEPSKKNRLAMWQDRWDSGSTRWHRSKVDPSLRKYAESHLLLSQEGNKSRVLVPLCGKSIDMAYLAQHERVSQVVGVEGVRKALLEFSQENPELEVVEESLSSSRPFQSWTGKSILCLQGDFFALDKAAAGGMVDAVWDRAALVAIEPSLREQYVATLQKVVSPGGRILLSTFVRGSGDKTKGPPYSIDEDEVRRLFEGQSWVKSVELMDIGQPWYVVIFQWLRLGLDEKIFLITAK